jgi:putative OPT family oligopeptide transporter
MSCVANIAIALAATTSQDLKTGFILGATPKYQQIGEIIGLVLPSIAIASTLYLLDAAYQFGSKALPAPQATLMSLIAEGVILKQLPLNLVLMGIFIGLILFLVRAPILPFAIGLYLPLSLSSPIMLGGIVSLLVNHFARYKEESNQKGVLISSGLVAGDACFGVIAALLTVTHVIAPSKAPLLGNNFSLIFFILLGIYIFLVSLKGIKPRRKSSN